MPDRSAHQSQKEELLYSFIENSRNDSHTSLTLRYLDRWVSVLFELLLSLYMHIYKVQRIKLNRVPV